MGLRKALLVGINDYPGAGSDLPSCLADVEAMASVLHDHYGFETTVLCDAQATLEGVSAALDRLCANVRADDRICFFYSGHGTTTTRRDAIEECLFLADGALLPGDEFVAKFRDVAPGSALVVLDACFSGGLQKFGAVKCRPLLDPVVAKAIAPAARYRPFGRAGRRPAWKRADEAQDETLNAVLLAACLEGETAAASTPQTLELSAFTYALLGTLALASGPVGVEELMARATEELRHIGVPQTPQLALPSAPPAMGAADFPLLAAPSMTRPTTAASAPVPDLMTLSARAALAAMNALH